MAWRRLYGRELLRGTGLSEVEPADMFLQGSGCCIREGVFIGYGSWHGRNINTKKTRLFPVGVLFVKSAATYSPTFCSAVPSAQEGLTSLFGMGRGGTPPLKPP